MASIQKIDFVNLSGDTPPHLYLDTLPPADAVEEMVRKMFAPFYASAPVPVPVSAQLAGEALGNAADLLTIVYVYGHAWMAETGLHVAVLDLGSSVMMDASSLLADISRRHDMSKTILILDCCHAAGFDMHIAMLAQVPRMVVYAADVHESAISLLSDKATQLAFTLQSVIGKNKKHIDLARVIADTAEILSKDSVIKKQTVSYRMHGQAIQLLATGSTKGRKNITALKIRNRLLMFGAVTALLISGLSWYYWSHAMIEVDLGQLATIAAPVHILVNHESPAENKSQVLYEQLVTTKRARFWVPAGDLILRTAATFADGKSRAIAFHLDLTPGWKMDAKLQNLSLPDAKDIQAHPGMAYIPVTHWYHGRDKEPRQNDKAYWIDISPPTVQQYLSEARQLEQSGKLNSQNSYLLTAMQKSDAIKAVGLEQIKPLTKNLGNIFAVIAADANQLTDPGDIVLGAAELPCSTCPAPMTRHEAKLHCEHHGKRLATDLEWELAIRGVDGRVYPWGDRLDGRRANIPGLPEKGQAPPALKPVDTYQAFPSPFGLIDTVGNAGNWVENTLGSYERIYMGATYRFNPEDATAYRVLPVTEANYLIREISARCVAS